MKMKRPEKLETQRLGNPVARTNDGRAIYNPTPLQSLSLSTISPINGKIIQESKKECSMKQKSYLKMKALLQKKKILRLFGEDISVHVEEQPELNRSTIQEPNSTLPQRIIEEIKSKNGTHPVFLYRKALFPSDTGANLSRLLITSSGNLEVFLTKDEVLKVFDDGLDILWHNPEGEYKDLRLYFWDSIQKFVINQGWNKVVDALGLKEKSVVELWGYRQDSKFCLVANLKKSEAAAENTGNASGSSNAGSSSGVISS